MMSEFDIVFDEICQDVFPKIAIHIETIQEDEDTDYVDIHAVQKFLTDVEGYDTDMATKIWDCYLYNNKDLLRKTDVAS